MTSGLVTNLQPRTTHYWMWACQKHKGSVLWRNEQCWNMCVCVIFLPKYSLQAPTGWESAAPCCLTTIKALSHLISSELLVIKFTAKRYKKTQKQTENTYLDVLVNTPPWLFTQPYMCLWHHQLRGKEKKQRNQTRSWWCQQACAASWVLNWASKSWCPCCGQGCLLGKWSQTQLQGGVRSLALLRRPATLCWIGQLWCFSWRRSQTKACAHLPSSGERK